MSIFDLNGPQKVVTKENIKVTEETKYFFPGIIHGSNDYIISAYGWSVGNKAEDTRVEVKYLYAEDILGIAEKCRNKYGNVEEDMFAKELEKLEETAESFISENDGSGNFYILNDVWEKSSSYNFEEIVKWAALSTLKLYHAFVYINNNDVVFKCITKEIKNIHAYHLDASAVIETVHPLTPTSSHIIYKNWMEKESKTGDHFWEYYSFSEDKCKQWLEYFKKKAIRKTEKICKSIKNADILLEEDNL